MPRVRRPLTRSEQMSRIRGSDTSPERRLRRALWSRGRRYRLSQVVHGIRPDIVFPRAKVVVFVDGCQWHGCPDHYVRPRTNEEFWAKKLSACVDRDARQSRKLGDAGWKVVRVWEHTILREIEAAVAEVEGALLGFDRPLTEGWRVHRVQALSHEAGLERRYMRCIWSRLEKSVDKKRRPNRKPRTTNAQDSSHEE